VGAGEAVDPEVSGFEPAVAVFAPDEGRALVERLIREVPIALAPGGVVALELGHDHAPWAVERLTAAGLVEAEAEPDLAGVVRLVFARRDRF
jgi:release factor glutamine methyltransferase